METETDVAVYEIDRNTSRFTVRAFATGMLSALGHSPTIAIRDFSGEARLEPEPSLTLRVRADSLEVTDDIPGKDRREMERAMQEDVLQSAKYPEIVFSLKHVTGFVPNQASSTVQLDGTFTIHGASHELTLIVPFTANNTSVEAHTKFSIPFEEWGMKNPSNFVLNC